MTGLLALPLMLLALQQPYEASIRPLPAELRADLVRGGYWKPGCPVPLRNLRLLTVTHWGWDGRAREGRLVVNETAARPLARVFRPLFELPFPVGFLHPINAVFIFILSASIVWDEWQRRNAAPSPAPAT